MPGESQKKFIRRMAQSFGECTEQTRKYGDCIRVHYEAVNRRACEEEFLALHRCFRAALKRKK